MEEMMYIKERRRIFGKNIIFGKITTLKYILKNFRLVRYAIYATLFISLIVLTIYSISHQNIVEKRIVLQTSEIHTMKNRLMAEYKSASSDLFYFSQSDIAKPYC